jgi:uncharacterized membrane protein
MQNYRGERAVGLIDGVYGVAVTLVALDLPARIIPTVLSGEFLTLKGVSFGVVFICQFIIMYDMWSIHKNISMKKNKEFTKVTEIISMIVLGLVVLSPGICSEMYSLFEKSEDLQSPDINYLKIISYGYLMSLYGLLSLMNSELKEIRINGFSFLRSVLYRFVLFLGLFLVSLITIQYGWVAPIPIIVLFLFMTGTLLANV